MANTYITSGSRFKPYTFAEMLQPVQIYTDASNAVETELSNLDILANDIVGKLNPNDPEDAKTLKVYEAFKTKMDDALETFYREGLTPDSKKALASLKSQYSKDINPINVAYERRVKDLDFIRQQKAVNPYLIIEGIGSSTSAYMNGNSPDPVVVDLSKASEAAKNASTGLSKQFIDQIGLQGVEGYIGEYLMYGVQKGITSDMVSEFTKYVDALKNGQKGTFRTSQGEALYNMFEQIRTANNYDKLSQAGKDRLDASIIQGLVSGAAADESINYTADRHWDIEATKQSINYTKARMQALQDDIDKTEKNKNLDVRTNTTEYTGKNYDVAKIADSMDPYEKGPIDYNGTKIYDPIQAYNTIHKDDAKISELENYIANKYIGTITKYPSASGSRNTPEYNSDGTIKYYVYVDGKFNEDLTAVNSELTVLKNQKRQRNIDLKDYSLRDKDVARIREYSKSSNTGKITKEELDNFGKILESDLTAFSGAQQTAVIFNRTNSKDGLEDMVLTISDNMLESYQQGNKLKVTDASGREVSKQFEKIMSSTGIDPEKVMSIQLDFISAERGAVKLLTSEGTFYVDADYIGDQAKAFIKRRLEDGTAVGIYDKYEDLMKDSINKSVKAELLNKALGDAQYSIQNQFTNNRQQGMSWTLSN